MRSASRLDYRVDRVFSDRYDTVEEWAVPAGSHAVRVLAPRPSVRLPDEGWYSLAAWGAVLLGAILLLALVAYVLRSRARRREAAMGPAFTIGKLRELRERGELTEAEFARLRARMVAEFRAGSDG